MNVVITQDKTVLERFSSEDEALLVRGHPHPVMNPLFDILNGVTRSDSKS